MSENRRPRGGGFDSHYTEVERAGVMSIPSKYSTIVWHSYVSGDNVGGFKKLSRGSQSIFNQTICPWDRLRSVVTTRSNTTDKLHCILIHGRDQRDQTIVLDAVHDKLEAWLLNYK